MKSNEHGSTHRYPHSVAPPHSGRVLETCQPFCQTSFQPKERCLLSPGSFPPPGKRMGDTELRSRTMRCFVKHRPSRAMLSVSVSRFARWSACPGHGPPGGVLWTLSTTSRRQLSEKEARARAQPHLKHKQAEGYRGAHSQTPPGAPLCCRGIAAAQLRACVSHRVVSRKCDQLQTRGAAASA